MTKMHTPDELSARLYLYRVFQRIFGDEPTDDMFSIIDTELLRESCRIIGLSELEKVDAFCAALDTACASKEQTQLDYMRLFIGPAALLAPPWESVYRDKQRLLMTQTTLDVRHAYRESGYAVQADGNVPDDHIATELDFLAHLALDALQAIDSNNEALLEVALGAEESFLSNHLRLWVDDFAATVLEEAPESFYAHAANLVAALVKLP